MLPDHQRMKSLQPVAFALVTQMVIIFLFLCVNDVLLHCC